MSRTKKDLKENEQENKKLGKVYPVLPLRDIVLFPHMVVPLFVGREKSVHALDSILSDNKEILLVTQTDPNIDDPTAKDLHKIGTLATVLQMLRLPDGTVKILVEGSKRAEITHFIAEEPFLEVYAKEVECDVQETEELEALTRSVAEQFELYATLNRRLPPEAWATVSQLQDPSKLADAVSSHLNLKINEKQKLLETRSLIERLETLFTLMEKEINVLQVEKKIRKRVKTQMEKSQKEYYLNEQMKAIQKELNNGDESDEFSDYLRRINSIKLSK